MRPGALAFRIGLPVAVFLDVGHAAGIAKNRADGVANIKSLLIEHTGEALQTQFQTEIEGRKGRFKGLTVEDGFKDFLDRKGRKPRVS